jgi:hypothetical protein
MFVTDPEEPDDWPQYGAYTVTYYKEFESLVNNGLGPPLWFVPVPPPQMPDATKGIRTLYNYFDYYIDPQLVDEQIEDGMFPIILRFPFPQIAEVGDAGKNRPFNISININYKDEILGADFSKHIEESQLLKSESSYIFANLYYCEKCKITPGALDVWAGKLWVPLLSDPDWTADKLERAYIKACKTMNFEPLYNIKIKKIKTDLTVTDLKEIMANLGLAILGMTLTFLDYESYSLPILEEYRVGGSNLGQSISNIILHYLNEIGFNVDLRNQAVETTRGWVSLNAKDKICLRDVRLLVWGDMSIDEINGNNYWVFRPPERRAKFEASLVETPSRGTPKPHYDSYSEYLALMEEVIKNAVKMKETSLVFELFERIEKEESDV